MKLLLDQNLSHPLVGMIPPEFAGSAHVRDFGMATAPDDDLWSFAATNGFVLVSKDTDFQQRALLSATRQRSFGCVSGTARLWKSLIS